jgi:hypothetical protein
MSIQHRVRAVRDRLEDRAFAGGGKRKSLPAEFPRSSEQPSVDHERAPARDRIHETAAPPPARPKRTPRRPARKSSRQR